MREILFRAKTLSNGWKEGFIGYTKDPLGTQIFWTEYRSNEPFTKKDYVLKDTIGQYTGLTDKNGVKIYEGDIVRFQIDNDDCPFPNKHIEKIIGEVFYSDWRASFSVTMGENLSDIVNNDLYNYIRGGNRVEVIGSIHDTPELREEATHA